MHEVQVCTPCLRLHAACIKHAQGENASPTRDFQVAAFTYNGSQPA
jgi:hypothetical protein